MKNINTNLKKLLFIALLSTTFTACKKEDMPASSKDLNQVKVESEHFNRRARPQSPITYSETFKLLSFTGTKLNGDDLYSAYLQLDWSVVGEKDVATYDFEGSLNGVDNWNTDPTKKITISNTTDSLKNYTRTYGFGVGGTYGKKINRTNYSRLKITLLDNTILYSSVTKINYSFYQNNW